MKTLICMGDSLTEGTDMPVGHAWPALVGNALNIRVTNCGIGGDTTAGMLARFYPEVIAAQPDFTLIIGGTNDLWWGIEINTILANLFSMVVQARRHRIAPVIGLPLPIDVDAARQYEFSPPWGGYDRFTGQMDRLIEKTGHCAAESEVSLVDLHRPFLSGDGKVRSDMFLPDGLHPNRAGQRMVANAIERTFSSDFLFRSQET
jgi:lysophospholipase L1-like esterase